MSAHGIKLLNPQSFSLEKNKCCIRLLNVSLSPDSFCLSIFSSAEALQDQDLQQQFFYKITHVQATLKICNTIHMVRSPITPTHTCKREKRQWLTLHTLLCATPPKSKFYSGAAKTTGNMFSRLDSGFCLWKRQYNTTTSICRTLTLSQTQHYTVERSLMSWYCHDPAFENAWP